MCCRACCLRCSLRGGKCIWDCLEVYSLTLIFALPSLWINRTDGQKLLMLNSYGGSKNFRKSLQVTLSRCKSLQGSFCVHKTWFQMTYVSLCLFVLACRSLQPCSRNINSSLIEDVETKKLSSCVNFSWQITRQGCMHEATGWSAPIELDQAMNIELWVRQCYNGTEMSFHWFWK